MRPRGKLALINASLFLGSFLYRPRTLSRLKEDGQRNTANFSRLTIFLNSILASRENIFR